MAQVKIGYSEARKHPDQIDDIMNALESGTSKEKGARPRDLSWCYDYALDFPGQTLSAVFLRGSRGRWWHVSSIPVSGTPQTVKDDAKRVFEWEEQRGGDSLQT